VSYPTGMRQDGLKEQQLGARECDTHQCSVEVAAGSLLWPVVVDPDLPNLDKEVPTGHAQLWTKGIAQRCNEDGTHWWNGGSGRRLCFDGHQWEKIEAMVEMTA
jgi:hypothetical protein